MNKFRSCILIMVIGLSIAVPVSAEITVPDEVKKMSGEEGYKRGYEDAMNLPTPATANSDTSSESYKIGDILKLKESEISIFKVEKAKSDNNKDSVRVFMTFKNLGGKVKSPAFDLYIDVFQDGVELEDDMPVKTDTQWLTKVKPGGLLNNVVMDFELQSDTKEIILDIKDDIFEQKPVSISIKLD